jgi:CDP-glucose 4,6-dehydratase
MRTVDKDFWKGKRVFLTGHTGFKGSWLSLWLKDMAAIVKGYSLEPYTEPSLFEVANVSLGIESEFGDIRDYEKLKSSIESFLTDIILHLAAQPIVRDSYEDPLGTYETNVMGTANLLQASRNLPNLKSIVIVTTDKCYENKEWEWGYRENEAMGGYDPYSSSKGCAELVTSAFRRSFFPSTDVAIATARA